MDVGVQLTALGHQPGERLAEMALLRGEAELFIERDLLGQRARADGVGAMIDEHGAFPRK